MPPRKRCKTVIELKSLFHVAKLTVLPEGCLRRINITAKVRKVPLDSEVCRYSVRCLTADNDWGHRLEFLLSRNGIYLSGPEISQPEALSEIFIRDTIVLGYNNQYGHTPRWYRIQDQDKLAVQYGNAGEILLEFNCREKSPEERQKSRGSSWRVMQRKKIKEGCPEILAWMMSQGKVRAAAIK